MSDILIKGMEMPTNCADCKLRIAVGCCGNLPHNTRMPHCPLVPVPPHGRLIDIDAPYQIQVHVDGLTKKGGVDIYAPAVLDADPAEEGE